MAALGRPIDPVALSQALVRCPSVTPEDAGALDVAERALTDIGFRCTRLPFGGNGRARVDNLYARLGTGDPVFAFAGHTDVVPPGDRSRWSVDPFAGEIVDGHLVARGAADMKSGVASFIAAASRFVADRGPGFGGSIALILTGDEEGDAVDGTVKVLDWLRETGERLDFCVVGEPTSKRTLGDTIKIGRRGSLNGRLTVRGVQGHTAYPQFADNPVHRLLRVADALLAEPLDTGNAHFEPSTLNITSIDVGNPASNVIPAEARAAFNIRFNDNHTGAALERWMRARLADIGGDVDLDVKVSGEAFLTAPAGLAERVADAVYAACGTRPRLDTGGGTSDARFIKDHCPVVECGLVGATVHQTDERVPVAEIEGLTAIYAAILNAVLPAAA